MIVFEVKRKKVISPILIKRINFLKDLLLSGLLGLSDTTELLLAVLLFLTLLTTTLGCFSKTDTDKTVLGFKLLQSFNVIIDQSETSGLSTTKVSLEAKDRDNFFIRLVHLTDLGTELILGDVGESRVDDIDDHLLTLEQTVGEELASSDSDSSVGLKCNQN